MSNDLDILLAASAARHSHLCPKQVLGVRAGLAAGLTLEISLPQKEKHLLVILETDGCFADGVEVATGATIGHRTMRVQDYGKIAATFANLETGKALRIIPHPEARECAWDYAPGESLQYNAQLIGYQHMPDEKLFVLQDVELLQTLASIISQPGIRTKCEHCGEEIINEREVKSKDTILCRACAGEAYYTVDKDI